MDELHIYIHVERDGTSETSPPATPKSPDLRFTHFDLDGYLHYLSSAGITVSVTGPCQEENCEGSWPHDHKVRIKTIQEHPVFDPDPVHCAAGDHCSKEGCNCLCEHQHNPRLLNVNESRAISRTYTACPLHNRDPDFPECSFGCTDQRQHADCTVHGVVRRGRS